jgi:hypothetical protein
MLDGVIINGGTINNSSGAGGGTIDVTGHSTITGDANLNSGHVEIGSGVTLTLDNVTVSGTTFDATAAGALLAVSWGKTLVLNGAIINGGTLENNGDIYASYGTQISATFINGYSGWFHGAGTIDGNVANDGTIRASGGLLEIMGGVTGVGTFAISESSYLAFGSSVSSSTSVQFLGSTGTLWLNDPLNFSGGIYGLAGSKELGLAGFEFGSTTLTAGISTSFSTVLTVEDAYHAITVTLYGDYTGSTFSHLDHQGGILIVEAPVSSFFQERSFFTIVTTEASDDLTGTSSSDIFVFDSAIIGHDTIMNFQSGADVLQFDASVFQSVEAIWAAAHSDDDGNTVIALGEHDSIKLIGTQLQLADIQLIQPSS